MLIILLIPGLDASSGFLELSVAQLIFLILFVLGSLSDMLDGYIARHFNQITDFGKFLDPIADKILVFLGLLYLLNTGRIFLWCVTLILLREFLVSGIRLVEASSNKKVIAASIWGKLKTTITMLTVVYLLVTLGINYKSDIIKIVGDILLYLSVFFTLLSGFDYIYKSRSIFSGSASSSEEKK
jgi:CDP-diacylglycerol--glycerol-3-phosphate 3-phosphatidyltransferase